MRNMFAIAKVAFAAIMASIIQTTTVDADDEFNKPPIMEFYLKAAFGRSDYLIKPVQPYSIEFICSMKVNKYCEKFASEVVSFIPTDVAPTFVKGSSGKSLVDLYVFATARDKLENPINISVDPKWQRAVYDDGQCAVYQFLEDYEVKRIIVAATLDLGDRLSRACIVTEMLRASGISFKQKFNQYSKALTAMTDADFENALQSNRDTLKLHWSPTTQPGMDRKTVLSIIK
jgi:hypothetical protein